MIAELQYQKDRAQRQGEVVATPPYIFERYRRAKLWRLFPKERLFHLLGDLHGKSVLDFACGEGVVSTQLAAVGAHVTGIDISPELIDIAERRAKLDGLSEQTNFLVCDILKKSPEPASFDYVVCSAALHHVDLYTVAPVLFSCLKPGGSMFIMEPISFSKTLQWIRDRLPIEKDASPDERQLNRKDVDFICRTFPECSITYFALFSRLVRLFPNAGKIDKGHPFTKAALLMLFGADQILSLFPFLHNYFGQVFISGRRPSPTA